MPLRYFFAGGFIVVMVVGGVAWGVRGSGSAPEGPAAALAPARPVIVRLVGRAETMTVTAGPGGPRYSLKDASGKALVTESTLEALKRSHPALGERIDATLAGDRGTGEMIADIPAD